MSVERPNSTEVQDPDARASGGRPSRSFRDHTVAYITGYVRSRSQLTKLAHLLRHEEATLRRWLAEDAPDFLEKLGEDPAPVQLPAAGTETMVVTERIFEGALGIIQRSVIESQAATLVRAIQANAKDLLLSDIRLLLNSHLGELIENMRLLDLCEAEPAPKVTRRAAGASPDVASPASRKASGPSLADDEAAVLAHLRASPGWIRPIELRRSVDISEQRCQEITRRLIELGLIEHRGYSRNSEYAAVRPEPHAPAPTFTLKPPTRPAVADAIVAILKQADGPLPSSKFQEVLGCPKHLVYTALKALRKNGTVVKGGTGTKPTYTLRRR